MDAAHPAYSQVWGSQTFSVLQQVFLITVVIGKSKTKIKYLFRGLFFKVDAKFSELEYAAKKHKKTKNSKSYTGFKIMLSNK